MNIQSSSIRSYLYLLITLAFYHNSPISSQNVELKFEHIGVEQGLANEMINDIVQDKKGFLWIATDDGLNKYDGYKFTVYKNDPDDPFSLSHNNVNRLLNTEIYGRQILFVGTWGGGLNAMDVETEKFIHWEESGTDSIWDSRSKGFASVIFDKSKNLYRLWYSGANSDISSFRIGYAEADYTENLKNINWRFSKNNPVLDVGKEGEWDSYFVGMPAVLFYDGEYHMWYTGSGDGVKVSIGYATSADGLNWTKYNNNPVLEAGGEGNWSGEEVILSPSVIHDGEQIHIWYTGMNSSRWRGDIGHAVSDSGISWKKDFNNPVLKKGVKNEWNVSAVCNPSVIFKDNSFHMWYYGYKWPDFQKIGYAVSEDGTNWVKYPEPVLTPDRGVGGQLWNSNVIWDGRHYTMFYTEGAALLANIAIATSNDGVNWNKINCKKFIKDDREGLTSNYITAINVDGANNIWIGCGLNISGLNQFTIPEPDNWFKLFNGIKSDKKEIFKHFLLETVIAQIEKDNDGNLWMAGRIKGIFQYNYNSGDFYNYKIDRKKEIPESYISIQSDNSGCVWAGSNEGDLLKLELNLSITPPKIIKSKRYFNDNQSITKDICEFSEDFLMISRGSEGLEVFNIETGTSKLYKHNPSDNSSISNGSIGKIYKDNNGMFWVGSKSGINKFNPHRKKFENYLNIPGDPNSIPSNYIGPILVTEEEGNRILWISTKGGNLSRINRQTNTYRHLKNEYAFKLNLKGNDILSMIEDNDGYIWMGTNIGFHRYNPVTNEFKSYLPDMHKETGASRGWSYTSILEDEEGNLWLGEPGGLERLSKKEEIFDWLKSDMVNTIYSFKDTSSNILWLGMQNFGLRKFNKLTYEHLDYLHSPDKPGSISSNQVSCIAGTVINGEKTLWLGTSEGLNKVTIDDKENEVSEELYFVHYSVKEGLAGNIVCAIVEDNNGKLWISTNNGISRFDPVNGEFKNYNTDDGLPGNEFIKNSFLKTYEGEIFFGGNKGLTSFFPDSIYDNVHIPEIILTEFRLFNTPVKVKPDSFRISDKYYLPKNINYLDTLLLSYHENNFSLEFAALDFQNPQKNKYAYIMDNFEKDWTYTDSEWRRVSYTNLDPGEYIFKVKGSNNDGFWNNAGKSLVIIITPPWWTTTWAYAGYISIFLIIVYLIWNIQLSRIRLKHAAELEHIEAEKYRDIDRLKTRFFANISHEFRTPLTLILGPVEKILDKLDGGEISKDLKLVRRNAKRLYNLINQLLDLSKLEAKKMTIKASEGNIVPFLKGLVMSFASVAERKNIILRVNTKEDNITIYFDKEVINKIIINIISNACKFTESGGSIELSINKIKVDKSLSVRHKFAEGYVEIKISDTGVGIPPDRLEKIFDRFFQVDSTHTREREGTGIGLSLTKELVDLHKGEISVESEEGKGTTFTLRFLLGKSYLKPEEIAIKPIKGEEYEYYIDESELIGAEILNKDKVEPDILSDNDKPIILIVEDNEDVRNYIKDYLYNKYSLVETDNGIDGLSRAIEIIPDLILSDVMMPKMDGVELCYNLKSDERTSHIPVILLTAKASGDDKIEGLETGADDYIMKPFDAQELQVRIKNLIEQRRKLKEHFKKQGIFEFEKADITSMDKKFLQKAIKIINDHLSDSNFNIDILSDEIALSRSQLNRKFSALLNESPGDFIRRIRLSKAAKLIESRFGNISEISLEVGFNNPAYFSKCFKVQFNQTPSEYEKSYS